MTEPAEVSLVTQMSLELSTAIPAGPKPNGNSGQSVVVAQEVAPPGISMRPVLVVTQTSFLLSMAIFPKDVGVELVPAGAEKEVEGGGLPPVPPPPVPQAGRDKRKIMRMKMRPIRATFCLIRFSPNLSRGGILGVRALQPRRLLNMFLMR